MTETQTLTEADLFVNFEDDSNTTISESEFYFNMQMNVTEFDLFKTDVTDILLTELLIENGFLVS